MGGFRKLSLQIPFVLPDMISGGIIIWSGAIGAIPAGYVLCDGNNGTPDLRNKFVIAAGDTYAVAAEGGSNTHTHTDNFSIDAVDDSVEVNAGSGENPADNGHNHGISGAVIQASNLPVYYSLAYIMKT